MISYAVFAMVFVALTVATLFVWLLMRAAGRLDAILVDELAAIDAERARRANENGDAS